MFNFELKSLSFWKLLCSLQSSRKFVVTPSSTSTINGFIKKTVDSAVQTEPGPVLPARTKDMKQFKANVAPKVGLSQYHHNPSIQTRAHIKRATPKHGINGMTGTSTHLPSDPVVASTDPAPSTSNRKKTARSVQSEPTTRELRSRSKNNVESSLTSISSRVCQFIALDRPASD